jgi:hypothetical protein
MGNISGEVVEEEGIPERRRQVWGVPGAAVVVHVTAEWAESVTQWESILPAMAWLSSINPVVTEATIPAEEAVEEVKAVSPPTVGQASLSSPLLKGPRSMICPRKAGQ